MARISTIEATEGFHHEAPVESFQAVLEAVKMNVETSQDAFTAVAKKVFRQFCGDTVKHRFKSDFLQEDQEALVFVTEQSVVMSLRDLDDPQAADQVLVLLLEEVARPVRLLAARHEVFLLGALEALVRSVSSTKIRFRFRQVWSFDADA